MKSNDLIKRVREGDDANEVVNVVVYETRRQYERIILEPAKDDLDILARLKKIRKLGIKAVIASRNPKTEILVPKGEKKKIVKILKLNHYKIVA